MEDTEPSAEELEAQSVRAEMIHLRTNVWHITQRELGERLGVSTRTITNWEGGEAIQFPQLVRAGLRQVSEAMVPVYTGSVTAFNTPVPMAMPVPDKLREALGYLREAHSLMDRLESMGQSGDTLQPVGLAGLASMLSEHSASLVARMRTMFGDEAATPTGTSSGTATYTFRPSGY